MLTDDGRGRRRRRNSHIQKVTERWLSINIFTNMRIEIRRYKKDVVETDNEEDKQTYRERDRVKESG